MELQAGKCYRTRNGRKACVAATSPGSAMYNQAIGWIGEVSSSWRMDGKYCEWRDDGDDLVAEWVEPKSATVELEAMIFPDGSTFVCHQSHLPLSRPIGRKRVSITVTEGEGV